MFPVTPVVRWLPMNTAPKDGLPIMVFAKGAEIPAIVFWSTKYNQWIDIEYEDLDTAIQVCGADWVLHGGDAAWDLQAWSPCPVVPSVKITGQVILTAGINND